MNSNAVSRTNRIAVHLASAESVPVNYGRSGCWVTTCLYVPFCATLLALKCEELHWLRLARVSRYYHWIGWSRNLNKHCMYCTVAVILGRKTAVHRPIYELTRTGLTVLRAYLTFVLSEGWVLQNIQKETTQWQSQTVDRAYLVSKL